jgi:hypothetical protein
VDGLRALAHAFHRSCFLDNAREHGPQPRESPRNSQLCCAGHRFPAISRGGWFHELTLHNSASTLPHQFFRRKQNSFSVA